MATTMDFTSLATRVLNTIPPLNLREQLCSDFCVTPAPEIIHTTTTIEIEAHTPSRTVKLPYTPLEPLASHYAGPSRTASWHETAPQNIPPSYIISNIVMMIIFTLSALYLYHRFHKSRPKEVIIDYDHTAIANLKDHHRQQILLTVTKANESKDRLRQEMQQMWQKYDDKVHDLEVEILVKSDTLQSLQKRYRKEGQEWETTKARFEDMLLEKTNILESVQDKHKKEVATSNSMKAQLEQSLSVQKDKLESLQRKHDDEVHTLQANIGDIDAQILQLRAELADSRKESLQAKEFVESLERAQSALLEENRALREDNRALQKEIEFLNLSVGGAKFTKDMLDAEVKTLKTKLEQTWKNGDFWHREAERLRNLGAQAVQVLTNNNEGLQRQASRLKGMNDWIHDSIVKAFDLPKYVAFTLDPGRTLSEAKRKQRVINCGTEIKLTAVEFARANRRRHSVSAGVSRLEVASQFEGRAKGAVHSEVASTLEGIQKGVKVVSATAMDFMVGIYPRGKEVGAPQLVKGSKNLDYYDIALPLALSKSNSAVELNAPDKHRINWSGKTRIDLRGLYLTFGSRRMKAQLGERITKHTRVLKEAVRKLRDRDMNVVWPGQGAQPIFEEMKRAEEILTTEMSKTKRKPIEKVFHKVMDANVVYQAQAKAVDTAVLGMEELFVDAMKDREKYRGEDV